MFATPRLRTLAQRVRPTAASRTRLLPVVGPVAALLPERGLRRGSSVRCNGPGALSLALALAAGPSAAGSWCAAVGLGDLGVLAAAGYGLDLGRLVLVRPAPGEWAAAAAALLEGIDLLVVAPPAHPRPAAVRTLAARARDRGAVLVVAHPTWPADLELAVEAERWHGLAEGAGRLQARRVAVVARGRGSAVRPVRQELWLPTATGGVAAA